MIKNADIRKNFMNIIDLVIDFYVYGKVWKESGHIVTAACVGTYDEHAHWDYIVMKDKNPDLVAPHTDCYSWTDEMWDEALEILDTAVFDEGKREGGAGQSIEESYDDNIAVQMRVTNVPPTGLTVNFEQYDFGRGVDKLYREKRSKELYIKGITIDWDKISRGSYLRKLTEYIKNK